MNKTIKKIINPTTLLICIFAICFFLLNKGLITLDDKIYQGAFNNIPTCIKWITEFYTQWSGRITLTVLINIFANLPTIVFKICNVAVFIITILASYKIIKILSDNWNKKIKNILLITIFCSIFSISIPVINSGALWIAGAMNYFWPVSSMLVAMIPLVGELKGEELGKRYYIFAILSNIVAGFAEQTSAILLAFGIIVLIWCKTEKKKISKLLIIHLIIITIFTAINLLAPGNETRSYSEELKWYPSYSSLTLMDKLVQGYIQMANHIINNSTILFSIMAILSSYFIIKNKEINTASKCVATIPILYVILKILPFNTIFSRVLQGANIDGYINQILFNFNKFSISTLYRREVLIQLISSSTVFTIVIIQLIYAFRTKKTGIITAIICCASICSALIMSFSPTIYASGNRVYTATDFLLIIINGILWTKLFSELTVKREWLEKLILFIIIIIGLILYINLYKTGISNIIY